MGKVKETETVERRDVYGIFDKFLKKTVIDKKCFFDEGTGEIAFNKDALEKLVDRYVKKFIGKSKQKQEQIPDEQKQKQTPEQKLKKKLNKGEKEGLTFEEKVCEQLFNYKEENVFGDPSPVSAEARTVFGNLMWLQYLPARKPKSDKDSGFGKSKCDQIKNLTKLQQVSYDCDGRAKYGMAAMRLDDDLTDLILMFNELVQDKWKSGENGTKDNLQQIKDYIIKWCLDLKENRNRPNKDKKEKGIRETAYAATDTARETPQDLLPIHNMLLHLCRPEHYDDISVTGHKAMIVDTFEGLIPKDKQMGLDLSEANMIEDDDNNYNRKYYIICNEIYKLQFPQEKKLSNKYKDLWGDQGAINHNVRIYDYKDIWNTNSVDEEIDSTDDYSPINALRFKKAIILYGPPGTSKTYSAKKLAKAIIFREQKPQPDIKELFNNNLDDQIHRLQLHPNWTYEDFIWGYQIENEEFKDGEKVVCMGNKTVARKGYFLKLLDKIREEKTKKTHVLILDEINRVDLSRLFGELFSGIENRNEAIKLPVCVESIDSISIPDNLYIIGTMNEIDFSLERVDFALRRRFAWSFYGYDKDTLKCILEDKLANISCPKFNDNARAEYIQSCTGLNKKIDEYPDLGSQYQIGHTFFAELVDIWAEMPKKDMKFVKTILWNISIGPMIEAYLGNCDRDTKKDKVNIFRESFGIEKYNGKRLH